MIDIPPELDTPEFHSAWAVWETHRREIGKSLKPTGRSRQLLSLSRVGVANAIAMIDQSIEMGWTGLFDVKGGSKPAKYQGLKAFMEREGEE